MAPRQNASVPNAYNFDGIVDIRLKMPNWRPHWQIEVQTWRNDPHILIFTLSYTRPNVLGEEEKMLLAYDRATQEIGTNVWSDSFSKRILSEEWWTNPTDAIKAMRQWHARNTGAIITLKKMLAHMNP